MLELLLLFADLSPAIAFLALPFLASTVGALLCASVHRRLKGSAPVGEATGPWLERRLASSPVRVGIAPMIAGSADGYWPGLAYIGLAPRTWVDRTLAGRTVAAHELGHASLWVERPRLAERLATARRVSEYAFVAAGAGFVVGALLDHAGSVTVGFAALVVGLVAHLGVLADEAHASWRGRALLKQLGLRTRGSDLAMVSAFGVYAVPFLIRALFLMAAPGFSASLLASTGSSATNSPLALWAVLLLFPLLLLRAAQVTLELHRPPRRTNDFQLNWTLSQEHAWAFHSGSIVLIWLALGYDEPLLRGVEWLFLLAILPAMRPLGGLGRLAVLMPLATVLTLVGFTQPTRRFATPAEPDPLPFLPSHDHPTARLAGLLRIAWLPLALVLVRRAVSGW